MKIAIFGIKFSESFAPLIHSMLSRLAQGGADLWVYEGFSEFLKANLPSDTVHKTFSESSFDNSFEVLLSIGGDGTILDAVTLVKSTGVPILGINTGRLGFLSSVAKEEINNAVDAILRKDYGFDVRSILSLKTETRLFGDKNFALNELTVIKKDSSSMISVQTFLDDEYINTYWGDGLIISTPTGSTAYSLSCGGPILVPSAENFILTPIAPHNLNVRPIVVSDKSKISLKIGGREDNFLVALDSRTAVISPMLTLEITKATYGIKLVKLNNQNFYQTLRNKLMWGLDKRN